MKKLILATLVGLSLVPQVQAQPISKFRQVKEHALGFWDFLYGKFYLTRNNNFNKNFEKGFEDAGWYHRYMKNNILHDISHTGANDKLEDHKYLDSVLTNEQSAREVFEETFRYRHLGSKGILKNMLTKKPELVDTPIRYNIGLFSPLIVAIRNIDYETVQLLVSHGANPYKKINPYNNSYEPNALDEAQYALEQIDLRLKRLQETTGKYSEVTDSIKQELFSLLQAKFEQTNILEYLKNQKNPDQEK